MSRSRSGLVLAVMRSLMALLFVVWIWLAPHHHAQGGWETFWLFVVYLAFALAMLGVAARSWWYEFRLARAAFVVDVATFLIGLYLTEAVTLDFFSSFMAFFAFLMLNSAARWSRRSILLIAAGLAACFLLAGWLVEWGDFHFDTSKFIRRFSMLAFLSLMLGWFAFSRQGVPAGRYVRPEVAPSPLPGLLDHAMRAYGAEGGALAWVREGETRPSLCTLGLLAAGEDPVLSVLDRPEVAGGMIFDQPKRRVLGLIEPGRLVALSPTRMGGLIDALPVEDGLSIPLNGRTGRGQLVLIGLAGLNGDDLFSAQNVAQDLAAALDESETEAMARELAMARLRSQIAADLHDSVVQTLAGAKFRLEALRNRLAQGKATAADMDSLCEGLGEEQNHVRAIIDQLRRGEIQPGQRDLAQELSILAEQLAGQWLVEVTVKALTQPIILPATMSFEIQQILREATANAARHGKARHVVVELSLADADLRMAIRDYGKGFPPEAASQPPRSIAARVARLGGGLTVRRKDGQTQVFVTLPLEPAA